MDNLINLANTKLCYLLIYPCKIHHLILQRRLYITIPQASLFARDNARAISLKMLTSQRTNNTAQNQSKLIDLATQIELIRAILMPLFSNFPRNLPIHFACVYIW